MCEQFLGWETCGCRVLIRARVASCCCERDCRALQQLASSLGSLLTERSWQVGACTVFVLPAFTGDACLSNALRLADTGVLGGGNGGGTDDSVPAGRAGTAADQAVPTQQRCVCVCVYPNGGVVHPDTPMLWCCVPRHSHAVVLCTQTLPCCGVVYPDTPMLWCCVPRHSRAVLH
jgi:hypothetical protein